MNVRPIRYRGEGMGKRLNSGDPRSKWGAIGFPITGARSLKQRKNNNSYIVGRPFILERFNREKEGIGER